MDNSRACTFAPSGHSETKRAISEATKEKVVIIPVTWTKHPDVASSQSLETGPKPIRSLTSKRPSCLLVLEVHIHFIPSPHQLKPLPRQKHCFAGGLARKNMEWLCPKNGLKAMRESENVGTGLAHQLPLATPFGHGRAAVVWPLKSFSPSLQGLCIAAE